MEELFNGQLSFADIDAEKFLHVRRAHADRRVNAMDRLTDDVINELILFNGQLSFADIDAEKFLHVRRAHADRRVNAMDRLTDDVINELIQLCLPHYHIKAGEFVGLMLIAA